MTPRHGLPEPEDYVEDTGTPDVPAWQSLVTLAAMAALVLLTVVLGEWLSR